MRRRLLGQRPIATTSPVNKRCLGLLLALCLVCFSARADDVAEVRKAFESFVQYSKTADARLLDAFSPDLSVTQVIDTGKEKQDTVIPAATFLQIVRESIEMKDGSTDAYSDVKYTQEGDTVKVTCTCTPSDDKPEPFSLVYQKDAAGRFKIKAMRTTVYRPLG